jgi:DNA-binding SARP family transcriptional activator
LADAGAPAGPAAREALVRYGGELLPGLRYEDWTDAPREAVRRRYVALLDLLAAESLADHDHGRAVVFLERAISSDPYDEHRYIHGAEILLAAGRRGPALALLERARLMMDELGLPPSPAAIRMAHRLRAE